MGSIGARSPSIASAIAPAATAALIATAITQAVAAVHIQKGRPSFILGRQIQQGANGLNGFAAATKHPSPIVWIEGHTQPHVVARVLAVNSQGIGRF
jgi:hypothetical protein